ncbi:DEAD/DEAH box helicase family protein [Vibrio parahaemolyticus]|uniref:DEAD/DEAH box helicase n=2 Tax=Vibrio parahaemolyticus TaxID=670 RepID=UPI0011208F3D|nr:SNF2-related protein [Vibrio parahaemolyticus]EGQ8037361.1 DEAD/DEAH box helicase family protein [Vibrio parahaemolyticus]EHD2278715.1 DEAD/DEAH box helicase family protein [Vibrio parahaemolyticus]EHH2497984.1 DEAD/DEAH box helicase family protein [Vibrio parahaemolyticus]EHR0874462.1 DEAD/DEAH box helicase family protein [Vibrio parahaemolyticus]EID4326796.1 DEAD/DEAH box helicase family protein [Vibrio parahaemolyticus]
MDNVVRVNHPKFGLGTVEFAKPETSLVRFEHGFEECLNSELEPVADLRSDIQSGNAVKATELALKSLASSLKSINESWSVFSKSNINLLPHQLWVCHRVLRQWPTNQLIADDVGLGKTVEAGLILWPLIERKRVKRLLIVTPAPLVEQWHQRMLEMFDIRLSMYAPENDTDRVDYWGANNMVVASLPTLRNNKNGRLERMLNAEPWDMLIVDEAHHLNSTEDKGGTQGFRLIQSLVDNGKFESKLFFTATPHRGKEYGFFSLLQLLRPDLFNVKKMTEKEMRPFVKDVLIRNNKQSVTDMNGERLFKPLSVSSRTYAYSEQEQRFYDLLTKFIISGQAYASSLNSRDQRAVKLVLTAMQKLASSSVAAIERALKGRIEKQKQGQKRLEEIELLQSELLEQLEVDDLGAANPSFADELARLEVEFVETSTRVQLMNDELPRIKELLEACQNVKFETRITTIMDILETEFKDRTVVFFTEYKATQALLMGALNKKYGDGCVTFINGENKLYNVVTQIGEYADYNTDRYTAAKMFNEGKVRFIISTEAGGEGIDLQKNCFSMIHVDLPWNPMRLHQRVGRLNRYGQQMPVEVITLRNPDTVESRIWDLLNSKIDLIMRSVVGAMDEPENLMELILGMADTSLFNELFAEALMRDKEDSLSSWFDYKTKTFGGESIVQKVQDLTGRAERFDYQDLDDVPRLDLADLKPFFTQMLALNQRRYKFDESGGMSFLTPVSWLGEFRTKRAYERIYFDRKAKQVDSQADIMGFGHPMLSKAINQGEQITGSFAYVENISSDLIVFKVQDQITGTDASVKSSIVGIAVDLNMHCNVVKDEELIHLLNEMIKNNTIADVLREPDDLLSILEVAMGFLSEQVLSLGLPYKLPTFEPLTAFYKV